MTKSARDDLAFAPLAIVLGVMAISEDHTGTGVFLIILGVLWLSARIYEVFFEKYE